MRRVQRRGGVWDQCAFAPTLSSFVGKLRPDGNWLWVCQFMQTNGPNVRACAVAMTGDGEVLVTGEGLGTTNVAVIGTNALYLAKRARRFAALWSRNCNGLWPGPGSGG